MSATKVTHTVSWIFCNIILLSRSWEGEITIKIARKLLGWLQPSRKSRWFFHENKYLPETKLTAVFTGTLSITDVLFISIPVWPSSHVCLSDTLSAASWSWRRQKKAQVRTEKTGQHQVTLGMHGENFRAESPLHSTGNPTRYLVITYEGKESEKKIHTHICENPMDRGAWWAPVHRVPQSWTWPERLAHIHMVV